MIDLMFQLAGDYILVRIDGNNILFGNTASGAQMATIDGLKLSREGAMKEFPDLKDNDDWRKIAIERFKAKIQSMPVEDSKAAYIIADLKNYGYRPLYKQKQGWRGEKIGDTS